ncbi:PAS domain-containing sensor histidine kinase [Catenovulum maritimum]|uniref:PAS domain-containing sensor histidine kinase n=1 Tax=Catenovulum maritimum TaxID=1513271 RepID=UPI00065FA821|nr:PAS domain-containing sensor histidine kinase [Catenovulum maritimum]
MSHSDNQKQLEIINDFLKDAEVSYLKSEFFKLALSNLSELLNTQLIIHTNIYKDKNNNEYRFNHQLYSQVTDDSLPQHFSATFPASETPNIIKKIYQEKTEVETQFEQIASLYLGLTPDSQESHTQTNFHLTPFFADDVLVGMLIVQSDKPVNLINQYPALYHTIKNTLTTASQNNNHKIEVATFQTVLDLMPQRVFWKNRQSIYLGCNKAFSDDASLPSPDDIVGVTDYDIFPDQAELYRSDDANTMTTLEHLICSEEPQTHQNGNTIWLRTSKRPIIDPQEKVVGVVGTYDDITQLKEIQHELEQAKSTLEKRVSERTKELTETNTKLASTISELKSAQHQLIENEKMASLGKLVSGIAHEINTPLGIAVTSASHLEQIAQALNKAAQQGNLSRQQFLENCSQIITSSDLTLSNLERASDLVRSFKMIAVDQTHDEKRTLNLYSYLAQVINAMTPKTSQKNIRITLHGDENLDMTTFPGALSQITTNLIDNAFIHAFPELNNGEIKISFEHKNEWLKITFTDNGVGICESKIKNIFDPFYTTNRTQGGTGLGLSIVFNLITQSLGGHISCESKLEEWTKFTISLPISPQGK